jgi:hypothetical protein
MAKTNSSMLASATWMLGVSLVLFFLPAVNGLIGGFVGGYKAGTVGRALGAAILPALVLGMGLWVLFGLFGAPFIGFIGGFAIGVWALLSSGGLLVGALIGGAVAPAH